MAAWHPVLLLLVLVELCEPAAAAHRRRVARYSPESSVAMCLAVKDEHADLREWIEHHR